jgi:MFS family permease
MKPNRHLVFFLGWVKMILYFTQRWIFGPLIPPLMHDFSLNRAAPGLIGSASLWGYIITPVTAGLLSDRFGRRIFEKKGVPTEY